MRKTEISVIMPVYNVEKYLSKAIESILNQRFKNFELIIINDGSTDNSIKIIEKYAQKDSRITIINKKNEGVSSARNLGIEKAAGKYLFFCDSDDYVEEHMLEKLYTKINDKKAEIVISGFFMQYKEKDKIENYKVSTEKEYYFLSQKDFIDNMYEFIKMNLINTPWNKLYLSKIIKDENIKFENRFGEDAFFNVEYLKKINKVLIIPDTLYYWNRSRENSETDKIYRDIDVFLKEKYSVFLKLKELYIEDTDVCKMMIFNNYFASRVVQFVQELANSEIKVREKKNILKEMFKKEEVIEVFKNVRAESKMLFLCYFPLKFKMINLTLIMGYVINFVKNKFEKIFNKLKANEINKLKECKYEN